MLNAVTVLPPAQEGAGLHSLLLARLSTKDFADVSLSLSEAADVLWTCSGTTSRGHRVCPSARSTHPISTTLLVGRVDDLTPRAYRYDPECHALEAVGPAGDHRQAIASATLDAAGWLAACPVMVLLTADLAAARRRFPDQPPEHGERFVWMEAGHAAQNVYLWAAEHHLGAVLIAGLDDTRANIACRALVPLDHHVLGVIGVGHVAT